jgi:cytochrome P450
MVNFKRTAKSPPPSPSYNPMVGTTTNNTKQVLGGADTLAILLKATIYHILRTPRAHATLVAEVRSKSKPNSKSTDTIPHAATQSMPYLYACLSEAFRMHPVVGHILERVVPSTGLELGDGTKLPPGTIVGVNPWVVHYQEKVFGEQPYEFRPERWLQADNEGDEEFEARMRGMKDADLSFGGGNRVCLGRPLALVECYKVVATLFGRFDLSLVGEGEWRLEKQWFVWPHDVKVKMKLAEGVVA